MSPHFNTDYCLCLVSALSVTTPCVSKPFLHLGLTCCQDTHTLSHIHTHTHTHVGPCGLNPTRLSSPPCCFRNNHCTDTTFLPITDTTHILYTHTHTVQTCAVSNTPHTHIVLQFFVIVDTLYDPKKHLTAPRNSNNTGKPLCQRQRHNCLQTFSKMDWSSVSSSLADCR
jgi:hypothetical protein